MYINWKREWTGPTLIGVVSFGIGTGVGYVIATYQSRVIKKLSDSIDEVGADMAHLRTRVEENGERVLEASWDIIKNISGDKEEPFDVGQLLVTPDPATHSVFSNVGESDWNYEEEIAHRNSLAEGEPYILHRDEFDDEDKGYSHTTLTYYMGDDVLTDEHDTPLHNMTQIIGDGNLQFGKGSEDRSLVYIRNDRLEAEYEVILDHGFFQVEVLGQEIEDRLNTEKSVVQKFRQD